MQILYTKTTASFVIFPKISRSLHSTLDKFTGGTLSRGPAPSRPSSTHTSSLELPSGSPMGSSWSKPSSEAMPDRYFPFIKCSLHVQIVMEKVWRPCWTSNVLKCFSMLNIGKMENNFSFCIIPPKKLLWRNNTGKHFIFLKTGAVGGGADFEEDIVELQDRGRREVQQPRATSGLPRIQVRSSNPGPPQQAFPGFRWGPAAQGHLWPSQDSGEVQQPRATTCLPRIQVRSSSPGPPQAFPGFRW